MVIVHITSAILSAGAMHSGVAISVGNGEVAEFVVVVVVIFLKMVNK